MTLRKSLIVAGLSLSVFASVSASNPAADTNKDGTISRAEFIAASKAKFTKSDINTDGYISQSEREQSRDAKKAERNAENFDRMDLNGDGFITKDELETASADRADDWRDRREAFRERRRDNQLSDEDRAQRREQFEARREKFKEFRQNGGTRGEGRWERIDTNGDDLISAQEHLTGAEKMFDILDADGDGQLSKGEGAHRKKRRKRGGR